MAPFDDKYPTSYPMAKVMFALSATICEIFANQVKYQKFYLENEGQCRGVKKSGLAPLDKICSFPYW